ncbi:MAG: hypothetical protein GY796_12870 [Chloroflexi bacterium]|nr:hypothetical protein [Chloroflexota bacterium]
MKMTKRKSRKRRRKKSNKRNQTLTTIIIIAAILLGAYFLFTGSDPIGLFDQEDEPAASEMDEATLQATPPGGQNSDWWQVYFTTPQTINDPENLSGSIAETLIGHISDAEDSIHIASFEFNLTSVADALVAAQERGVEVQWVTDDEHGLEADHEEDHGQFALLEDAGIPVKDDDRSALMHNKFWIFDNQTVWSGSTNITRNGIFRNNNNVVVLESLELAGIYEREFAEMWNGEFGPRSPSTIEEQSVTIDGSPVRVLFAAEDEVIDQLVPLIENAQSSIRFMAFSFTHDDLGTAVLDRANAGVDVMGIFETRGSETEYSELPALYCAEVPVRQDGNPGTFHHKVFIIDNETVITGSFNFSNNANESNDENVLIITNAAVAEQYLHEFDQRWTEASEPESADMNCK